jgi:hypothetical protein
MWPAVPSAKRAHRRSKQLTHADLVRHSQPTGGDSCTDSLWQLSIGERFRRQRLQLMELLHSKQALAATCASPAVTVAHSARTSTKAVSAAQRTAQQGSLEGVQHVSAQSVGATFAAQE